MTRPHATPPSFEHRKPLSAWEAVPAGLDWQAFSDAYFPDRHRHDLEALTAYGAYKRARVVAEPPSEEADRSETAERSAALDVWEDEGGPAP